MKSLYLAFCVIAGGALFLLGGGLVRASKSAPTPAGIAFVDVKRAIDSTEDGKKATAVLRSDLEAKRKEITEARAAVVKAEKAKEKPAALADRRAKAEQLGVRLQSEYDAAEKALAAPLLARARALIEAFSMSRHVVILSSQIAPFMPPGTDLTDEIIRAWPYPTGAIASSVGAASEVAALRAEIEDLKKRTR